MKHQKPIIAILLFIALGIYTFFFIFTHPRIKKQSPFTKINSQVTNSLQGNFQGSEKRTTSVDSWDVWIEKQGNITFKLILEASSLPWTEEDINELQNNILSRLATHAAKLKKTSDTPPPLSYEKPTITKRYNTTGKKHFGSQTVESLMESFHASYAETAFHRSQDERYPPQQWLKMLLDRGITIENYSEVFRVYGD